jgi:hypothetical protein
MPGHPPSSLQAVHAALAALERYQSHQRQLALGGVDPELYHRVSLDIQEVRRCCHAAPALSAAWVALLIAHAELSQALWRAAQPQGAPTVEDRQRLLAQVLDCVHALHVRCMELAAPPGAAPPRDGH